MKYTLFVLLVSVIFMNCQKNGLSSSISMVSNDTIQNQIDTPIIALEKSAVLKNGILWNVPINAFHYPNTFKRFVLHAKVLYSNFVSESLTLQDIPCRIGIYSVEYFSIHNFNNLIPEVLFSMTSELDQPMGYFTIDTTRSDHFVEVIRYDSIQQTVEGRFQVFLRKEPTNVFWPNVPDSIFLTEGKFHLKIQEP